MRYHQPQPTPQQRTNASKHRSKLAKANARTKRLMEAEKKRANSPLDDQS